MATQADDAVGLKNVNVQIQSAAEIPTIANPEREVSVTRFGIWATNLSQYAGSLYIITGLVLLLWGISDNGSPPFRQNYDVIDVIVGIWAIVSGSGIIIFEKVNATKKRSGARRPHRTVVYTILAIPGFMAFPTMFASALILIPAGVNFYSSFILGETYTPPQKRRPRGVDGKPDHSIGMKIILFMGGKNPEGRIGRIICVTLYMIGNFTAGILNYIDTVDAMKDPANPQWTNWVPWAKFFGGVMNLNFTLLLLPISRNLIRWLYNNSTGNQSTFSNVLRFLLTFIPLDQARKMHILMAWFGFFSMLGHVFCHLMNYAVLPDLVWATFGPAVWVTGVLMIIIMMLLYTATHHNVKGSHFEIFWGTHMLFPLFIASNIFHGKDWLGPNYWKWLLFPGTVYLCERIWRYYTSHREVSVLGVTFMSNNVMSLKLAKGGALETYKEGQYAYLCCPHISAFEWHPLTISSAPQDDAVTFHIRVQKKGSWTYQLQQYMSLFARRGSSFHEFSHQVNHQTKPGKIKGPDGLQFLQIYGPHSAPTQHLTEYNEVMLCTSGIGVTPLAASMTSIVLYRWRLFVGKTFPDKVHFFWITSHRELQSFRWFVRCVKEVEDALAHMEQSNPEEMSTKSFSFDVFVTSYKPENHDKSFDEVLEKKVLTEDEDIAYWGTKRNAGNGIKFGQGPFTEVDLYKALLTPSADKKKQVLGHVTVTHGRPKWNPVFEKIASSTVEENIGVCFCGNPGIGRDLTEGASRYTNAKTTFRVHKEVF